MYSYVHNLARFIFSPKGGLFCRSCWLVYLTSSTSYRESAGHSNLRSGMNCILTKLNPGLRISDPEDKYH